MYSGNLETYMVSHMKSRDLYSEKYSADVQWVLGLFFVAKVMGLTCGIITAGYGVGAVIYNEAATTYVNPDNMAATSANDGNK
nr:hypothetical protein BaRGS_020743 [Batillaria attramentaria]